MKTLKTEVEANVAACLEERGLPADASSPFCRERANRVLATITTFGDRVPQSAGSVSIIDAETIATIAADHPAEDPKHAPRREYSHQFGPGAPHRNSLARI